MAQYEMNLRDYWLIIRRRKLVIIGTALLTMLISWAMAQQKVPYYQATAAVKFEQSTSMAGLLVEVLSSSNADSIETQATLIKSYPILEDVARRMGKLPDAARGQDVRESKAYTAVLDDLAAKIRISRIPNTSILEITVTSVNAREARDLANTVAEAYRDSNRGNRNARITEARKFIESQLKDVEMRVKRAGEEMWAFRQANRVISPGAESTVLLAQIEKTRQQRTELELLQARLAKNGTAAPGERVYVDTQNPAMMRLQANHTELVMERNNLALEVTDRHPRLQALDDRIREVRAEMRRELGAQVNSLRQREEILERQMAELLQRNREVPAVELSLQRDAKVNDDLLTLLKTRHQEALIKESEGIDEVTLIRPAADPPAPVGAETVNTVIVGMLLGLILGLALAFVQEKLDTSIETIEDVESYVEVPVLGAAGGGAGRGRRYRNLGLGLLSVLSLAAVLGGVTAWRIGFLGDDVKPRELLRRRLDSLPAPLPGPSRVKPAPAAAEERLPSPETTIVLAPPPTAEAAWAALATAAGQETPRPLAPSPAAPAPATPEPAPRVLVAPTAPTAARRPSRRRLRPSPSPARFALEFGPFGSAAESDRVERLLTQAGYQTVRFRQQMGATAYTVLIERMAPRDAAALLTTLREQGFTEAVVVPGMEPPTVRVGEPVALRGAVNLAERLRGHGHQVRIAATPGEAVMYVIRHGNFAAREDAEATAAELQRLGLAHEIVRIR